jgi:hypothetical protein
MQTELTLSLIDPEPVAGIVSQLSGQELRRVEDYIKPSIGNYCSRKIMTHMAWNLLGLRTAPQMVLYKSCMVLRNALSSLLITTTLVACYGCP